MALNAAYAQTPDVINWCNRYNRNPVAAARCIRAETLGQVQEPVQPLAQPGPVQYQVSATVPAGVLNVRAGPGVHHEIVGTLPAGSFVTGYRCLPRDDGLGGANWCQVKLNNGLLGWASLAGMYPARTEQPSPTQPMPTAPPPPTVEPLPSAAQIPPSQPNPDTAQMRSWVTTPAAAESKPEGNGPEEERKLVIAIERAREAYAAGANDMAKGAARPARAKAICAALNGLQVRDWVGTVDTLSTNGDGLGVLSVKIGKDIWVETWNNGLSDTSEHTLIDPDSALFKQAMGLTKDQEVTFSGHLFHGDPDCIRESSLTMNGSIGKPEFIFRFSHVEPQR
jgi:hypothetical protein